jgi:hypothetical protein
MLSWHSLSLPCSCPEDAQALSTGTSSAAAAHNLLPQLLPSKHGLVCAKQQQ